MSDPILIDGWTCEAHETGRTVQAKDGSAFIYDFKHGLTGTTKQWSVAPPAVLAWLVAPLIDRGYGTGHAAGMATAREIAADEAGFAAHQATKGAPRKRFKTGDPVRVPGATENVTVLQYSETAPWSVYVTGAPDDEGMCIRAWLLESDLEGAPTP